MKMDLVIQNGHVIDPAGGISGNYDIAVHKGKVVKICPSGASGEVLGAITVIDAKGDFVIPGLIDMHAHVFPRRTTIGIEADTVGVCQGVTTVVDAGSAGVNYFPQFVSEVVDKNRTEVMCWINIAKNGLCEGRTELRDIGNVEIERTVELIGQHPVIRGIKVRMSGSILGENGLKPLEMAKSAANKACVPLMVHVGNRPPELKDILDLLERGDVVTHAFHGKPGGIMTEHGELLPAAQKALARGVIFDVGHGKASFNFNIMKRARAAGVKLNTISTDIHLENWRGPVYSMATTMSKFLALGYSLDEVVTAATSAPAAVLGLSGSHGSLAVGRTADITVFSLSEGEFDFADAEKNHLAGKQLLKPRYSIRAGKVLPCI